MDFSRLSFVAERASYGDQTQTLLSVIIPETPGSFLSLYNSLHPHPVLEFSYRYGDASKAHIFIGLGIPRTQTELSRLISDLKTKDMIAKDVSNDEVAKMHARFLIGGRSKVPHERVFRFTFPERPGALNTFLTTLMSFSSWNVSLFHYKNAGGDVAYVFVGIQVPDETSTQFSDFLRDLKYPYVEETDNEVYKDFLRG